MKKQTEIKWLSCLLLVMIVLTGIMTDFSFHNLKFQLHDTYFVVRSFYFIVYGALIIYTVKNLFLLIDLIAERYKILALLISIINPLVALFLIFILYLGVQGLVGLRSNYPEIPLAGRLIPVVFVFSLLIMQVIVEVKMLRRLKELIGG